MGIIDWTILALFALVIGGLAHWNVKTMRRRQMLKDRVDRRELQQAIACQNRA